MWAAEWPSDLLRETGTQVNVQTAEMLLSKALKQTPGTPVHVNAEGVGGNGKLH